MKDIDYRGLEALFAEKGVRLAYLFGSRARGEAKAESDFDIALDLELPEAGLTRFEFKMDLTYRIAKIMGVSENKVDLVFLAEAPPLLQYQVIKEGKLLFIKDEDYRAIYEARIVKMYLDTQHLRRVQYRGIPVVNFEEG
ncbi:MAG: nucleotidyltransferase domain-containing protein [Clostridia bacterium]|nr:nucleotidyltransferase domain-containing protein [Clostridia bacterium]